MDGLFTVIVVDGDYFNAFEICSQTDSVRFDGLTWEDSMELARLSFMQGFEIVIWRQDEGEGGTNAGSEQ